jgi:hypothetical protein
MEWSDRELIGLLCLVELPMTATNSSAMPA